MNPPKILGGLLSLFVLTIAATCGSSQNSGDNLLKHADLVLGDQVATHAFALELGQTVAVHLINRSTPATASDPSVLERVESMDSSGGMVTTFRAIGPGATVIEPGSASCGPVACANSGIQATADDFYIFVTEAKNKVTVALTLSDYGARVALRQDERAALVLLKRAPFRPWAIPGMDPESPLAQEGAVTTASFTWVTFRPLRTGISEVRATATPACTAGAATCAASPLEFAATISIVAAGASTVMVVGDRDNGARVELKAGEVIEVVLRQPPFNSGGGTLVSVHPKVLIKLSSSASSGASILYFQGGDGGFTQLLSAEPNCRPGNQSCPSLYELSVFVFP